MYYNKLVCLLFHPPPNPPCCKSIYTSYKEPSTAENVGVKYHMDFTDIRG